MERNFDDLVDSYAILSADERKQLVEYVRMHPERAPGLEDARVEAFFAGAADEPITDAVLARYASMRLFDTGHDAPAQVREACRRVERALASDPEVRKRFDRFADRIAQVEASSKAAAQFERLTGRRLSPATEGVTGIAGDRGPRARRTPGPAPLARWVALGALVVLVCYAAAFSAYRLHPPLSTAAHREAQERLENWDVRSVAPAASTDEERLRAAIEAVRSSFYYQLGVLPRYRRERLRGASAALWSVSTGAGAPEVRHEARYFLGLAELALGDTEAARIDLQAVSNEEGFRSPGADDVLEKIEVQ